MERDPFIGMQRRPGRPGMFSASWNFDKHLVLMIFLSFSWVSDSRHVELFDLESTLGVHQDVEGRSYLSLL